MTLISVTTSHISKKVLAIEESICLAVHQEKAFDCLTPILDNL